MAELKTEELRKKADDLGIKYTSKTSDDTLLSKIEAVEKKREPLTGAKDAFKSLRALKRVKVISLCPEDRNINCKYVQFMNSYITIKKAVALDTPIFLEQGVISYLKEQKYTYRPDTKKDGKVSKSEAVEPSLLPRYQIIELPDLTKEELDALKKDKSMRDATIKDE